MGADFWREYQHDWKLTKKCLRIITFSNFDAPSNQLFIDLKVLKIRDVIKLQTLKLAYEFWNGLLPNALVELFSPSNERQTTNVCLRSSLKKCLTTPQIKTVHSGDRSLRYKCVSLWNQLITKNTRIGHAEKFDLSQIYNVSQFKRQLKKHFEYSYTQINWGTRQILILYHSLSSKSQSPFLQTLPFCAIPISTLSFSFSFFLFPLFRFSISL